MEQEAIEVDVAVVGGGPAGIAAGLALSREAAGLSIALFESDETLGGIPQTCHLAFGMRDLKRVLTGPAYARKLSDLVGRTTVRIHTQATVLKIVPGDAKGTPHHVHVASPEGFRVYACRYLLLATGCCERSFASRLIPNSRPAGIFTTWQLQQMVSRYALKPGKRALIVGSEDAALSTAVSLRRAGVSIAGMVEEDERLQTYPLFAKGLSRLYGFPLFTGTEIRSIKGIARVEGVELSGRAGETGFSVECDTVIVSGRFRPIAELIDSTPIEKDPASGGPLVDMDLMTSVPGIFAAGNVLRGGDMHDLCALEGRTAARSILARLASAPKADGSEVSLRARPPIRYVVPQGISPSRAGSVAASWRAPGFGLQMERSIGRATLEAWSGEARIWRRSFSRLIANHRITLPVAEFDWGKVDPARGIELVLVPEEERQAKAG